MKKFLAVCAFLALSGAAMAYDVSTSFKGTVDVKFNWVNFADLDQDEVNCNDWYNFAVKYDAYLVLCYDEILCPICPVGVDEAYLWLVDKKSKQVFFSSLADGGITDIAAFCFGNGYVAVGFTTFMPYFDLADVAEWDYATSPEVTFVLTGGRQTTKQAAKTGFPQILNLTGGIAFFDVSPADRTTMSELECTDGSEVIFANVSFKKDTTKIKADPYCPLCATDCWSVYLATEEKVYKATKKFFWWEVWGEDDVAPFYSE